MELGIVVQFDDFAGHYYGGVWDKDTNESQHITGYADTEEDAHNLAKRWVVKMLQAADEHFDHNEPTPEDRAEYEAFQALVE